MQEVGRTEVTEIGIAAEAEVEVEIDTQEMTAAIERTIGKAIHLETETETDEVLPWKFLKLELFQGQRYVISIQRSWCVLRVCFVYPIRGKIVKIESFGAFVSIEGFRCQGLVHISQIARDRVEDVSEVVAVDQEVFVKVLSVDFENPARPKISLSMKYASQSDGSDRDPNGVDAESMDRKRRPRQGGTEPLKLDAVLNTLCKKCGGSDLTTNKKVNHI